MKVLHVYKDYFPPTHGGVEQHIHDLVHALDGVECTVLTSSRTRRATLERDGPVAVVRAREWARVASTPITPAWRRHLAESDAGLMHFHMPSPIGELAFLAARPRAPMVATYHADIVGRDGLHALFAPFQQRFLARARRIVVGSPVLRDTSPALAPHRARIVVIPYGVDADRWSARPASAEALRARHRPPLVLFLGRFRRYKGVHVLIDAMRDVAGTLLVVGDGPGRAALERRAAEAGLADRTVFAGEVPDELRAAYYHAADVFVLPSTTRAESFGIAMLEAMACGTPVICTEVGTGTTWLNRHDETGLVVPPDDARALAAALTSLLADGARRREMGLAAASRVRESFTKRAMVQSIGSLYAQVG